jgi:hypothetical protein
MTQRTHRAIVGRTSDLHHARDVLTALQNAGVDAADIRLGGSNASGAEDAVRTEGGRERVDRRAAAHVGRRAVTGAVVGALIGVVLGGAGAGILVAVDAVGGVVAVAVVVVALIVGGTLGSFLSVERSTGLDETWELTFDDDDGGATWVAARVHDDHDAERVREVFARHGVVLGEEHRVGDESVQTARW